MPIDDVRSPFGYFAWPLVNVAVTAQIARIVEDRLCAISIARGKPVLNARQRFAVMFDLERAAVFAPIRADGADAVRANRNHFVGFGGAQGLDILLGHLRNREVVAEAPRPYISPCAARRR